MRLLIAFIAVPLIEIGLFIQVGDAIGLWPTLLIVLLTAIAGTALVRSQGTQVESWATTSPLTLLYGQPRTCISLPVKRDAFALPFWTAR